MLAIRDPVSRSSELSLATNGYTTADGVGISDRPAPGGRCGREASAKMASASRWIPAAFNARLSVPYGPLVRGLKRSAQRALKCAPYKKIEQIK